MRNVSSAPIMFWEWTHSGLLTDLLMVGLTLKEAFIHANAELSPICRLLALLGAHHILHVSRIMVKRNKISREDIHDYISSYQCSCQYSIYLAPYIQTIPKFGTQSGYFTL
jgi:hypothetical protein